MAVSGRRANISTVLVENLLRIILLMSASVAVETTRSASISSFTIVNGQYCLAVANNGGEVGVEDEEVGRRHASPISMSRTLGLLSMILANDKSNFSPE